MSRAEKDNVNKSRQVRAIPDAFTNRQQSHNDATAASPPQQLRREPLKGAQLAGKRADSSKDCERGRRTRVASSLESIGSHLSASSSNQEESQQQTERTRPAHSSRGSGASDRQPGAPIEGDGARQSSGAPAGANPCWLSVELHKGSGAPAKGSSSPASSSPSSAPEPPFRFAGILASLLASVLFSLSILFVKLLPEYDGFAQKAQVIFFRGLVIMILCSLHLVATGTTFLVQRAELLANVLRAIFGTLGIFGVYCALNYISTGDATAIVFSSPIWTSILSYFILGEPLQWIHLVALPASLFGIVLIAHPTLVVPVGYLLAPPPAIEELAEELSANLTTILADLPADDLDEGPQLGAHFDFAQRWPGIAIALLTSLAVAVCFIVLKFRKTTAIQTTTFWLAACMSAFGALVMCLAGAGRPPSSPAHWLLLLANGLFSWLAQSVLQWAFAYEAAGTLSIVRTFDVAVTFVLSALLLDERIVWTSVLGAAIISSVVAAIVLNNWLATLPCCCRPSGGRRASTKALGRQLELAIAEAARPTLWAQKGH